MEGNGRGGKGRKEEGERKGEGERNKNPPSDRSGYGPVLIQLFFVNTAININ